MHKSAFSSADESFMAQALQLAERGSFTTMPNPRVGCVLVRDHRVIGAGWHERPGGPHAEAMALAQCTEDPTGATAYVTLEPCAHTGRTAPCADALIKARVARVVAAIEDPNPLVAGQGLARLRAAGIRAEVGLLVSEASALNAGFLKRHRLGLPWVRIKMAQSLDGRTAMASGESQWITGERARVDVQSWRARSCAVMTGAGTILKDDPQLNVRNLPGLSPPYRQPLRVVLDRRRRVPASAKLFSDGGPVLRVVADEARSPWEWQVSGTRSADQLECLLRELARRECNEIWLEAGATLAGAFVAAQLIDEWVLYVAPKILGANARALVDFSVERLADAPTLSIAAVDQVGEDLRIRLVRAAEST